MTELPDRLLRDALRPGAPATASHACVDAEALAAWADGTMNGAARAAFEIHAADCARCQALMAAMARTESPPIESAWWRRSPFAWIMPLAAAAAAAVVVVDLAMTERAGPAPASPAARTEAAARDRVLPPTGLPAPPATASPAVTAPARAAARRHQEPAIDQTRTPAPTSKIDPRAKDAVASPTAQPVATPPPAAPTTPTTAQPAPAAGAGTLDAVSSLRAEETRRDSAADRAAASRAFKQDARVPLVIVSPARESQWRIVDGRVGHTEDGGVTWQAQALAVDVPVRAGAAPAARVCWLAGARGLVLLTTDGAEWRRLAFPESVDLVAIEATDASHATVTTATGRRFSTGDGGKTWTSR